MFFKLFMVVCYLYLFQFYKSRQGLNVGSNIAEQKQFRPVWDGRKSLHKFVSTHIQCLMAQFSLH